LTRNPLANLRKVHALFITPVPPEHLPDAAALVDAQDDLAEQLGDGEDSQVGQSLLRRDGNRIRGHNLPDGKVVQPFGRWRREDGVRETQINVTRAVLPGDVDRVDHRAAGVYLLVHDDDVVTLHVAHQRERLRVRVHPPFLDQGQGQAQFRRQVARLLGETQIRGDNDRLLKLLFAKVVGQDGKHGQNVTRDAEEALNLRRVQVE
jgi:hypothetical protein